MATSAELSGQMAALDQSWNPTQVYNDVTTKLGIPDARTRVQGLQTQLLNSENAIKAVDPSVTGRTQNSIVTESQRQRLVNMERQPLTETYNDQNKQYGLQQGQLADLMGQATTQQQLAESGYKSKRDSLSTMLDYALKQEEIKRDEANRAADRATAASSGGGKGGSAGGDSGQDPKHTAFSQQRKDGGYNFQGAKGEAISARRYAQIKGIDFNSLLRQMATAGDKGAADILKNGGSSKYYKNLTWD